MSSLNKNYYIELVKGDINFIEQFHPGDSIEKNHIISILNKSIADSYPACAEITQAPSVEDKTPSAHDYLFPYIQKLSIKKFYGEISSIMEYYAQLREQSKDKEIQQFVKELSLLNIEKVLWEKEKQEMIDKLKTHLSSECVRGWDEVKFCSVRNGNGGECQQCIF